MTPEDLVAPANKSGYSNVSLSTGPNPYQAFDGGAVGDTRKHAWKGPRRPTALEAAQDYCDHFNAGNIQPKSVRQGFLYLIRIEGDFPVKVGFSDNPTGRMAALQTGNPRKLVIAATIPGSTADEARLHRTYKHLNMLNEWFMPSDALLTEFNLPAKE